MKNRHDDPRHDNPRHVDHHNIDLRHDDPPGMRTALVTGASSGIGRAAATALARDGYAVALAARRAARLEEVAASIEGAGGTAAIFPIDLEQPGAPADLVSSVIARFARLDVLVNNAGWGYCAPLEKTPEDAARRIFTLNLLVPFLLMKACVPHIRRTGGVVINVSSGSGLLPSPYYSAYAASKAGLVSLSDALRIEQLAARDGPRVRVVSLCPGPVTTEFGKVAGGAPVHGDSLGIRIETAEEIGDAVARLVRRPRRTVATTAAVRAGALVHRWAPPLFEWLALRWARRIRPTIERSLQAPDQ